MKYVHSIISTIGDVKKVAGAITREERVIEPVHFLFYVSFDLSEASAQFIYLFFLHPSHNRRIEITMSVHNILPGVFIQDQLIVSMKQIKCSELFATRESSEDIF